MKSNNRGKWQYFSTLLYWMDASPSFVINNKKIKNNPGAAFSTYGKEHANYVLVSWKQRASLL